MRGILPPLVNAVVMNTVMFGVFNAVEQHMLLQSRDLGLLQHLAAGAVSGVAQACHQRPSILSRFKFKLVPPNAQHLFRNIIRTRPRALATGHIMNMWREGVFTAIYLGVYANWRPGNAKDSTPALLQVAAASGITGQLLGRLASVRLHQERSKRSRC